MFRGDSKDTTFNQDLFDEKKYQIQTDAGDAVFEYKTVNAAACQITGRDDGPQKDAVTCSPLPHRLSDNPAAIQRLFQTGCSTIDQRLANYGYDDQNHQGEYNDSGATGIIGLYDHQNKRLHLAQLGDGVAFLVIRVISSGLVIFAAQLSERSSSSGKFIFGFAGDKKQGTRFCTPHIYDHPLDIPDNCEVVLGVATRGVSRNFVLEDVVKIFRKNPHEGLASIAQQIVAAKLGPDSIPNSSIVLAVLDQSLQVGLFDGCSEHGDKVANYLARHALVTLDSLIDRNKDFQKPLTADEKKATATQSQLRKIEQLEGLRYIHHVSDEKSNTIIAINDKFQDTLFDFCKLELFHASSGIAVERVGRDDYVCRQGILYQATIFQADSHAVQFLMELELVKTTVSPGLVQACFSLGSAGTTFLNDADRLGSPAALGTFEKKEGMVADVANCMASLSSEHKGSPLWSCCLTQDQVREIQQTVSDKVGEVKAGAKTPEIILAEVTHAQLSGQALPFFSYLFAYNGSLSKVYSPEIKKLHEGLLAYRQFCFSYSISERLVQIKKMRNLVDLIWRLSDPFYNPIVELAKHPDIKWQEIKNMLANEENFLAHYAPAFSLDPFVPSLLSTPGAVLNAKSPSGWISPKLVVPIGLVVAAGVIAPPVLLGPAGAIISAISGGLGIAGYSQGSKSDKHFEQRAAEAARVCPVFVSRREQPLAASGPASAAGFERKRALGSSSGATLALGERKSARRPSTPEPGLGLQPLQPTERKAPSSVASPDIVLNIEEVDAPHLTGRRVNAPEWVRAQKPGFLAAPPPKTTARRRPSVSVGKTVESISLPVEQKSYLKQYNKLKEQKDKQAMLESEYKDIFNEIAVGLRANLFSHAEKSVVFPNQLGLLLTNLTFTKFMQENQLLDTFMTMIRESCKGKPPGYEDEVIAYVREMSPCFNDLPGVVQSAEQNLGPGGGQRR